MISDNGQQFACHRFHGFAEQYGFHRVTSSPRHPQSNGLVERGVQIVKGLLKKAQQSGGDFQLALLAHRTAPQETTGLAPARLLMGTQPTTTLPATSVQLRPFVANPRQVQQRDGLQKQRQKQNFDARHGCRELQPLQRNDHVLVWNMKTRRWRIPAVVKTVINPRSYVVKLAGGGQIRRNRQQLQLRPSDTCKIVEEDEQEEEQVGNANTDEQAEEQQEQINRTRSGRQVRKPGWKKEYVCYN